MLNKHYDRKENEDDQVSIKKMLQEQYKENWVQCRKVFAPRNAIVELLGEIDADVEWDNNPEDACEKFLNIEAYKRFEQNENIVLIGRTGTGKSSILNRYKYAVENKEVKDFLFVVSIRFQKIFDKLIKFDFEEERDTIYQIQYVIKLVIRLFLLVKIADRIEECNDISIIRHELELLNIETEKNITDKIYDDLDDFLRENGDGSKTVTLEKLIGELKRAYKPIMSNIVENAMNRLLAGEKVVVLIDSLDYYDIQDKKAILINKTLVELAFEYFRELNTSHILMKVALPSEVYTYILEQIVAKKKGKIVTIEWSYKEIVKMLAIKIYCYLKKEEFPFASNYVEIYRLDDFNNYDKAYEFLHTFLPKMCSACIPINFEALPHCIRHTQKKPRQIIQIFNAIMQKIVSEKNYRFFIENEKMLRDYIHIAQCGIIEDALSMYNQITKKSVLEIVDCVLHNKKII